MKIFDIYKRRSNRSERMTIGYARLVLDRTFLAYSISTALFHKSYSLYRFTALQLVLFSCRKEVIHEQVLLPMPCSCLFHVFPRAWTISSPRLGGGRRFMAVISCHPDPA